MFLRKLVMVETSSVECDGGNCGGFPVVVLVAEEEDDDIISSLCCYRLGLRLITATVAELDSFSFPFSLNQYSIFVKNKLLHFLFKPHQ